MHTAKRFVRERNLQRLGPAAHQLVPIRRLHIVRLDLQTHFGKQVQCLLLRELPHRGQIAVVGIAPAEIEVDPRQRHALLQLTVKRILPCRLLVTRQGLTPTPLPFQLQAFL